VVSSIVQLPAGHGIVGALAGGWNFNAIGTFYSARPISGTGDEASPGIISGRDNDFDGNASNDRPVVVGEWRLPHPTPEQALAGQPWLNPAAFRQNLPGENNVLARNAISGPALKVIDLGLAKRIPTGGRRELQLRVDAFNLFNWVNFRDPVGTLTSPNFGKVLDSEPGRTIQLGARYSF
jgi:outer membrane receptor protein involved in Fe transport